MNLNCSYHNPYGNVICNRCGSRLLLAGRYRALRQIGAGGFARTFEAIDERRLASPCVVKQFCPLSQNDKAYEQCLKLFKQEAEILKFFDKNSKIPSFFDFFEQEGRLYIVQEFIEGLDLFKEVTQNGVLNEQKVRQILLELLPVLQFIHDRQVIHRDIKPSNILRQPNGSLVLIDFGSSQKLQTNNNKEPIPITGTPGYASSEQMQGMACAASDIYSLGVTCMRLLSGSFPTQKSGDPLFDWQQKQWNWRSLGMSVSPAFGQVLDGMLQWNVRDRFACAIEVLQVLKEEDGKNLFTTKGRGMPATYIQGTGDANDLHTDAIDEEHLGEVSTPTGKQATPHRRQEVDVGAFRHIEEVRKTNKFVPQSAVRRPRLVSTTTSKESGEIKISRSSKIEASYSKLCELLIAQEYERADRETWNLMLHIANRSQEGCLNLNAIEQFPPRDLLALDRLWQAYSNGHFGFSIQKQIYQSLGGNREFDYEIWKTFGERVGWHERGHWLNYRNLKFSHSAPVGHLPVCFVDVLNRAGVARGVCGWWRLGFVALIHRLEECQAVSQQEPKKIERSFHQTLPMLLGPEGSGS